ncbi:hypothetical protein [Streptomyces purpurascens]|uniref:Uncharacterized protein n=1 Tax=Streptomyces purpurascens TaxID=1924 RepID=A0ABZ1MM69_STREF|nr:hypothetical protein [Streptomyces purpurascens]MCE7049038.1 hypothetical protein [Streptomyces purpurascens]GHA28829.1 hypothetical protein GCM10010303_44170 [Streptomyces purpurascens]
MRPGVGVQPDAAPTDVLPTLTARATPMETALPPYSVRTHVRPSTFSHRRRHVS